MSKMTPRQMKIIEQLGEALRKDVEELSLSAAKGIVHFGLEEVCGERGIELAAVQEYDEAGKIEFMERLMVKMGERLGRYHVGPERVEQIKINMMGTYRQVM